MRPSASTSIREVHPSPQLRVRPPDDAAHDSGCIVERLRLVLIVVAHIERRKQRRVALLAHIFDHIVGSVHALLKQIGLSEELLTEAANVEPEGSGPTPDRLYRSYLSSLRERFWYVRGIPIRATYEAAPRYFLVHCTDHPDGLLIMNDVASCVDDDLYERSEREKSLGQLDCFGNARLPRVSIAAAASRLEEALAQRNTYRYRDLRMLLVEQFGPELRKKEHDRVIDRLVDDGRAQRFPANGRRDRATYRRWSPPRPDPGIDSRSSRPASSRPPLGSSRRLV